MSRFPKLLTGLFRDFRNSYNIGAELVDQELEKQKKRIDDLIKGTPQPSEVVDSRGGFPVLGDRLASVDSQLAQKATLTDVDTKIASVASGSPKGTYATLAALQTAFPTGTTGIYVVTADGKWYYWSGSAWTAGGTYQSTSIADETITREKVSSGARRTMDLLNNRNLFLNPNFVDKTSWGFITVDFTVDTLNATVLSNSAKFVIDTSLGYIYQDLPKSKFVDGNYTLSFLLKTTGNNTNANVTIGITGYPTTANSGGTSLLNLADQRAWTIDKDEWQRNTFTFNLTNTSAYDHIRVFIQCRNTARNYHFAEMYLGLTNTLDNSFSYVHNKLDTMNQAITQINNSQQNKLYNKSSYIDGDSISFGAGSPGGYGAFLASDYGAIITNRAVSGGTLATGTKYGDGSPRHYICESVVANVNAHYDYAIISGGFNDYGNNVPLGVLNSGDFSFDSVLDKTTVIGALETIFRHMIRNHPTTKTYFLMTHKASRSTTVKNTLGVSMQDYYNAIMSVCERYSIPVIDIYKNSRMITYFSEIKTYTSANDGVHPTADGYKTFYMPVIEKELGL